MQTLTLCTDTLALRRRFQMSLPAIGFRFSDRVHLKIWFGESACHCPFSKEIWKHLSNLQRQVSKVWKFRGYKHLAVEGITECCDVGLAQIASTYPVCHKTSCLNLFKISRQLNKRYCSVQKHKPKIHVTEFVAVTKDALLKKLTFL